MKRPHHSAFNDYSRTGEELPEYAGHRDHACSSNVSRAVALRATADHLHGLGIVTLYGNGWRAKTIRDLLSRQQGAGSDEVALYEVERIAF